MNLYGEANRESNKESKIESLGDAPVHMDYLAASLNFNIFRFALFSKFSNNGIGNDFVKPSGSHVLKF